MGFGVMGFGGPAFHLREAPWFVRCSPCSPAHSCPQPRMPTRGPPQASASAQSGPAVGPQVATPPLPWCVPLPSERIVEEGGLVTGGQTGAGMAWASGSTGHRPLTQGGGTLVAPRSHHGDQHTALAGGGGGGLPGVRNGDPHHGFGGPYTRNKVFRTQVQIHTRRP